MPLPAKAELLCMIGYYAIYFYYNGFPNHRITKLTFWICHNVIFFRV